MIKLQEIASTPTIDLREKYRIPIITVKYRINEYGGFYTYLYVDGKQVLEDYVLGPRWKIIRKRRAKKCIKKYTKRCKAKENLNTEYFVSRA